MLAWWMLVPTLLAMMVALVLPGFMWLRAGGRSSLVAIGAAPAFTFGLVTALSVAYPALDIEWEPSTALPVLGLSAIGGAAAWALSFFHRSNGGFSLRGVPLREAIGVRVPIGGAQAAVRASTWGAILVGFLVAAWPLLAGADPANPVQQWDPTFHQNGVHAILYGKDASPFGGLHELYGGRSVYYPTGWHAFVALFAPRRAAPSSRPRSSAGCCSTCRPTRSPCTTSGPTRPAPRWFPGSPPPRSSSAGALPRICEPETECARSCAASRRPSSC